MALVRFSCISDKTILRVFIYIQCNGNSSNKLQHSNTIGYWGSQTWTEKDKKRGVSITLGTWALNQSEGEWRNSENWSCCKFGYLKHQPVDQIGGPSNHKDFSLWQGVLKIYPREGWSSDLKWDGCFTNCSHGMEDEKSQWSSWQKALPRQIHHEAY